MSQEFKVSDQDSSNISPKENNIVFLQGGINISSFQNMNSEIHPGYSFGLSFTKSITNSIGLMFSILIEKENTYLNKLEGMYNKDDICYRKYYDMDISFLFSEFPVSLYYKFWKNESSAIYFSLGYGFSFAIKDRSKRTNFVLTDEGVIPYPCDYYPMGDYYDNEETWDNSGWAANAEILITYHKMIFKFLYINKRYPIKGFDKLQTLSFHLGYLMN